MEADWSVALGTGDPVITIPWEAPGECRFIDLRSNLNLIDEIVEVRRRPALRSALLKLNGAGSAHWTAKCDAWTSSMEEGAPAIDPYEMDAEPTEIAYGAGSYVDVLRRDHQGFACFDRQERWMRAVTTKLRSMPAKAVRVELVLRAAMFEATPGFAVSWFVEACGATRSDSKRNWETALDLSLGVIMDSDYDPG
jgi:hypothetical protein